MRTFGILITASVVLAAAQAAALVLYLTLVLALLYGLFTHPRETFGLLGFCILASLVERQPLACLGLAALITLAAMVRQPDRDKSIDKPEGET